jgi:hypothetical protein
MRSIMLVSLALLTSTASGQELQQEAPLEAIRPRSTPIVLEEDPPPAPPPPRKVIRRKVNRPVTTSESTSVKSEVNSVSTPTPAPRRRIIRKKVTTVEKHSENANPVVVEKTELGSGPPEAVANPNPTPTQEAKVRRVRKTLTPPVAEVVPAKATPVDSKKRSAKGRGHGGGRRQALLNFRTASIYARKKSTSTGSFIVGWDPVILPYKRFNFGLSLGITRFESESLPTQSAANFFVYEYGVASSYYVSRTFLPELIVGMQTWKESNKATSNLFIAGNANFLFRRRPMRGHLDRLYLGYGMLGTTGGATHILRAGIGFRF